MLSHEGRIELYQGGHDQTYVNYLVFYKQKG